MASPIEEIIEDLEDYIESCKPSAFSSSKITVNRDEIDALINELKTKIPDEVNRYKKVINNQKTILADAEKRAREIIASAQVKTSELVSEHQIMQQAYNQASEVVKQATNTAQRTLDEAARDANAIRTQAIEYTDNLLKSVQDVLVASIESTRISQDNYIATMQGYLNVVNDNRIQLSPNPVTEKILEEQNAAEIEAQPHEVSDTVLNQNTGSIDIRDEFFKKD